MSDTRESKPGIDDSKLVRSQFRLHKQFISLSTGTDSAQIPFTTSWETWADG